LFSYQKSNLKNQNCGIACGDEFSISDRVVKEQAQLLADKPACGG